MVPRLWGASSVKGAALGRGCTSRRGASRVPGKGANSSRATAARGAAAMATGGGAWPGKPSAAARLFSASTTSAICVAPPGVMPSSAPARGDTPRMRPGFSGPRSFTRSSIERPFSRLVTRMMAGNCRLRCAAVRPWAVSASPFAVRPPKAGTAITSARPVSESA